MKRRDYILESDLSGISIDNREDAIKYIKRCIEECSIWSIMWLVARHSFQDLEKEREEIKLERRRVSLTTGEDVSQSLETEEVWFMK